MRISDWSSDVCSSDLVGAGLHGDQHALGSQQRGARQGGNARRAVDDDVLGPPGEFWRLLVQRFACTAHGASQPCPTLLPSSLFPVPAVPCWVRVPPPHLLPHTYPPPAFVPARLDFRPPPSSGLPNPF